MKHFLSQLKIMSVCSVALIYGSCTSDIGIIHTGEASDITYSTALCGGSVNSVGHSMIKARGVYWDTISIKKVTDTTLKTVDGVGDGTFKSALKNLRPKTTYYVRAYASSNEGLELGNEISFTTLTGEPVITTGSITEIRKTSVLCGAGKMQQGASPILSCGICWSTVDSIPIDDKNACLSTVTGKDTFAITLKDLAPKTTYYVRAFAANKYGIGYGKTRKCRTLAPSGELVYDADGNVYHTVTIDTQVWLVENLQVTHYNNGDIIPNVTDSAVWENLKTGACCDYENYPLYSKDYGKLYNWYSVMDSRGIAPKGWHVSTYAEWQKLIDYLGGMDVAGGKLKETGTVHWYSPNVGATNESGFTALEGGARQSYFFNPYNGWWWTTTDDNLYWDGQRYVACPWLFQLFFYNTSVSYGYTRFVNWGLSVRCVAD